VDLFADFSEVLDLALDELVASGALPEGLDRTGLSVEPPRDAAHGDIAINAALVLGKRAGRNPRDLAKTLAEKLAGNEQVQSAEIAGPGFINLKLKAQFWPDMVRAILDNKDTYGASDIGKGERINVEYVSVNPTGLLHVGHGRGAVFGDSLANLLAFIGFDVTREYYINDAGGQIEALALSAILRTREALGEQIGEIPKGLYPGDYLKPVGEAVAAAHGKGFLQLCEAEQLKIAGDMAIEMMMAQIKLDLAALNIRHDVFFSERELTDNDHDQISEAIEALREKGLIYKGKIPPPKGQLPEDWEDREQVLFRASQFGDDLDRPLMKSNGEYTYFAADIAYHRNKINRGFKQLINVWGADHGGYVKRLQSAVTALSGGAVTLDILLCQLVRLFRGGEPVKMSKRAGEFVTLRDVVDEVGRDSVRFMMLYRKNDAPLDFDFVKVTEQSRENPVFYVQYAHARIHSVLRNAGQLKRGIELSEAALRNADFARLTHAAEIGLVRQLAMYPRIVRAAAQAHEPHRIAFYLYDVATSFHALWNLGKELPQLRFIDDDDEVACARLGLLLAVRCVIGSGLRLLGVEAVVEMR
jgi:arginyl-tRNA synthetase